MHMCTCEAACTLDESLGEQQAGWQRQQRSVCRGAAEPLTNLPNKGPCLLLGALLTFSTASPQAASSGAHAGAMCKMPYMVSLTPTAISALRTGATKPHPSRTSRIRSAAPARLTGCPPSHERWRTGYSDAQALRTQRLRLQTCRGGRSASPMLTLGRPCFCLCMSMRQCSWRWLVLVMLSSCCWATRT